jgi:hypothetical protein
MNPASTLGRMRLACAVHCCLSEQRLVLALAAPTLLQPLMEPRHA